ncbi:MAG: hypothetical protein ACRDN0_11440 [Trebonia sp.]
MMESGPEQVTDVLEGGREPAGDDPDILKGGREPAGRNPDAMSREEE